MASNAKIVLREALALSEHERADLVMDLLASLDGMSADRADEVSVWWASEIERRARRVLDGETVGEDWETLRRRLSDELAAG